MAKVKTVVWIALAGVAALFLMGTANPSLFIPQGNNGALLQLLHPDLIDTAVTCYNQAVAGLPQGTAIVIDSTFRTFQQQSVLYNQGRTSPGDIVTNALPGYSYHNYGLALDFHLQINGVDSYDETNPAWMAVVNVFTGSGFEWGGNFSTLKGDNGHLQMTFGFTVEQLLAKYNAGDFIAGTSYVNLNDGQS